MIDLLNPLADHELNRGLIAWCLPLDNTYGGQTLFDIAGQNHSSLTNGPTWGSGPGAFGALTFNGTTQYVALPSGSVPTAYPLTLTILARASNATAYMPSFSIGHVASSNIFARIGFRGDVGGDPVEAVSAATGVGSAYSTTGYTAGKWHLITGVFTSLSSRTVYLDAGGAATDTTAVSAMSTPDTWRLGSDHVTGAFLAGDIAAAWIHNRALSASEVYALYDQSCRDYPDLLRCISTVVVTQNVSGDLTLTADAAAYTYTASSAGLYRGYKTVAAAASYAYTGTAVTFPRVYNVQANAASYVHTGTAATLARSRIMGSDVATYVYTAESAGTLLGRKVSAAEAVYTYTATAASTLRTRLLSAAAAVYTYTAEDATLQTSTGIAISADVAAYTYTAANASLLRGYRVAADAAVYTYNASSASLLRGYRVVANAATYSYTAEDVTFDRTYIVQASVATYAYTGTDATLARSRRFSVDAAEYMYTAVSASLLRGYRVVASSATYSYTAASASLLRGRRLAASSAAYTVAGDEVQLTDSGNPGGNFGNHVSKIPLRG